MNVANTYPPDPGVGPCEVRVIFADQDGQPFGTRSDDWTALLPGQAAWIDLPAALVFGRDSYALRARVQASVETAPDPGPPETPPNPICEGLVSTFEIFDNLTGRTAAFSADPGPAAAKPPNPSFGLLGLARLQTLALTSVNLVPPPDPEYPPNPCEVTLSFLTAAGELVSGRDGQPLLRRAALLPGQFLALHLPASLALGDSAALRAPIRAWVAPDPGPPEAPDACAGLTNTVELVDAFTGRTSLLYSAGSAPDPGPPDIAR